MFNTSLYRAHEVNERAPMCYWTMDLVATFNTAYFRKGDLEASRINVAWRYTRTWLVPDLFILSLDCDPPSYKFKRVAFLRCDILVWICRPISAPPPKVDPLLDHQERVRASPSRGVFGVSLSEITMQRVHVLSVQSFGLYI